MFVYDAKTDGSYKLPNFKWYLDWERMRAINNTILSVAKREREL